MQGILTSRMISSRVGTRTRACLASASTHLLLGFRSIPYRLKGFAQPRSTYTLLFKLAQPLVPFRILDTSKSFVRASERGIRSDLRIDSFSRSGT